MNEWRCSRCKEAKPETSFNKSKANKNGLQSYCKDCQAQCASGRKYKLPRDKANAYQAKYRTKNRDRYLAMRKVETAIKYGRLTPTPCEVCGNELAEAHHASYALPLHVTWLCDAHHRKLHLEFKKYVTAAEAA